MFEKIESVEVSAPTEKELTPEELEILKQEIWGDAQFLREAFAKQFGSEEPEKNKMRRSNMFRVQLSPTVEAEVRFDSDNIYSRLVTKGDYNGLTVYKRELFKPLEKCAPGEKVGMRTYFSVDRERAEIGYTGTAGMERAELWMNEDGTLEARNWELGALVGKDGSDQEPEEVSKMVHQITREVESGVLAGGVEIRE